MNSSNILSITTFVYGLAGFCYIYAWIFKKQSVSKVATWVALIGLTGNIVGIVMRWVESYRIGFGHAPLSNLYESLVFFAGTIVLIYLVIERKYGTRVIGAFAMPLAFLSIAYASLSPTISNSIQPLIPALKSNWLIAHVITCFIGYSAFAVAFCTSWMLLLKDRDTGGRFSIFDRFPRLDALDELTHELVKFGFLFLTIGIITGAVWANSAWGKYWQNDPKEVWSAITWVLYIVMLHERYFIGWKGWKSMSGKLFGIFTVILFLGVTFIFIGFLFVLPIIFLLLVILIKKLGVDRRKVSAYLSILSFAAVMFTYFGVNLLPGLHSYGTF